MYLAVPPQDGLSQGDIIDGCSILDMDPAEPQSGGRSPIIYIARAIILTQECDLHDTRTPRVVIAVVRPCQEIVETGMLKGSTIRDQLRRHLMPGWYFLPKAPEPIDLPESIVDLRELHTVSKADLEMLATEGRRVCRIRTPWREHLNQHFGISWTVTDSTIAYACRELG
ncbi:MAG: hypothetical protein JWN86_3403 [Planctomycetota bacterium]|nr:hypothetical protein [Planctomycetota bacterium]